MSLEKVIKLAQQNNSQAERQLFDATCDHLKSVAKRYVLIESNAEDVLQETYIRIFKHLSSFNYINDAATMGWMRQITATEAIRYLKKNKKWEAVNELAENTVPVVIDDQLDDQLYHLLLALPPRQRIVFNMYALEGYSHKEISQQLEIAESSSRSILTRARSFLQAQVAKIKRYEKV